MTNETAGPATIGFKTIYDSVVGVDVHQKENVACFLKPLGQNNYIKEVRHFSTLNSGLEELCLWVKDRVVSLVLMESTGVYWVTLARALARHGIACSVVNPYHVKSVPGRKTDVTDSEWIAKIGCCGLVNSSFLPTHDMFRLRQLSRIHNKLIKERSACKNGLNKTYVESGLRIDMVASDVHGKSGRTIVYALLDGHTPLEAARMKGVRLKADKETIEEALTGCVDLTDDIVIRHQLKHLEHLDEEIEEISRQLVKLSMPYRDIIDRMMTIPGVNEISAIKILSEIGTDMTKFGSVEKISSWAGVCPGNNESAGKRRHGKRTKGNKNVCTYLVECSQAGVKTNCALRDKFLTKVGKLRYKKAIIMIAHKMLKIMYCIISRGTVYEDSTVDYAALALKQYKARWMRQLSWYRRSRGLEGPWGRPAASPTALEAPAPAPAPAAVKRPRGRPKGSGKKRPDADSQ
jgi:transposase